MGRLLFIAIMLIVSVVVGNSLNKSFQKAYETQQKKIALIENI